MVKEKLFLMFYIQLSFEVCPSLLNNKNLDLQDENYMSFSHTCLETDGSSFIVSEVRGSRGQKSVCFVTLSQLKGGSVSMETVCRCQMSYRWVMVTSQRAMGNFHRLEGRQKEDCLLTKSNWWRSVCLLPFRIFMLCHLWALWHTEYQTPSNYSLHATVCLFLKCKHKL